MTDAEIFDHAIASLGLGPIARFSPGHPESAKFRHVRKLSERLTTSARYLLPGRIHLDFVVNRTVNAFAFKSEDRYFIALTTGTVFMLELLFMRMLSDSRLFPDIGDANTETSDLPPLTCCIPNADEMFRAGHKSATPKTEPRHAYAIMLFEQAVLFLIGHEIAHITLGHVDYLQSKVGIGLLSELGWDGPAEGDLVERQCMEAQADMRSVQSGISSIKLIHGVKDPTPPAWSDAPLNVSHLIFLWAVATNTFFRLFGDARFDPSHLATQSYLPLALRRAMASTTAYVNVTALWTPSLKKETLFTLRTATKYTEHAFAVILGEQPSPRNLNDVFSPLGREHHQRLITRLSKLQNKLDPFCYEQAFELEPAATSSV